MFANGRARSALGGVEPVARRLDGHVRLLAGALTAAALAAAGCGDAARGAAVGELAAAPEAAAPAPVPAPDGAAGSSLAASPPFGTWPTLALPTAACAAAAAAPVTVLAPNAERASFRRLGALGARRFAQSPEGPWLVTLGAAAGDASPLVEGPLAAAADAGAIVGVIADGASLVLARWDDRGEAAAAQVDLGAGTGAGASIATRAGGAACAAWCDGADVQLARVDGEDVRRVAAFPAAADGPCETQTVAAGAGFVVLATRTRQDGRTVNEWVDVDPTGVAGEPRELVATLEPHHLADAVATASGWAALFDDGAAGGAPLVLVVATSGGVRVPGLRGSKARRSGGRSRRAATRSRSPPPTRTDARSRATSARRAKAPPAGRASTIARARGRSQRRPWPAQPTAGSRSPRRRTARSR
jgi:hypothetical protein